ncbi:MAG: hypothetical protein A2126_02655 [Candidatus Woykebacteria bacterium GWB1_45_5]|uniref:Uncharacterized protein n=2 Tax=Candidatus Woykeibacteriota TaxID=1817899 RepID=A0A1G1W0T2_9BACT|nr:MAG: hypothetical protein A2113_00560 [Candidatus Woykebacteria bacterium GWA1_44_8]OGY24725.1 MAG: hypothetical protein A2126_02655 [Candidatus Woykebacteria bacterium GWB1_45_5]
MGEQAETGCCKRFDPAPWQEKEVTWQDKLFLKDHVRSFLHIPLNMDQVMTRDLKLIEDAKAFGSEQLMLSDEKSLWGSDIYISVVKEVPGATMEKISGTFLTKVFEGPFKNIGSWIKEMKAYMSSKGKEIKKLYFGYTTCPACAKAYGKNYVVLLAQV